jgi:hypothetical protein
MPSPPYAGKLSTVTFGLIIADHLDAAAIDREFFLIKSFQDKIGITEWDGHVLTGGAGAANEKNNSLEQEQRGVRRSRHLLEPAFKVYWNMRVYLILFLHDELANMLVTLALLSSKSYPPTM